jgi:hypothetical protein
VGIYLTRAGFIIKGKPVQPVAIRHPFIHFDPCWVNGINLPLLMWRSLCQFSNYLQVKNHQLHLFAGGGPLLLVALLVLTF